MSCVTPDEIGPGYVYLLGIYLGDGMLTLAPKNVWRLRIFQDSRYTNLIASCVEKIVTICGHKPVLVSKDGGGCTEIVSHWKHWLCLFPQHGPGPKHRRPISLEGWQRRLVEHYPQEFIRGLIHSDGCRVINRVWEGRYEYVRYHFTNTSDDIRRLFMETCAMIGVDCRPNNRTNLSVARRKSVAILESFVDPKS
jgi:hypothetical protein